MEVKNKLNLNHRLIFAMSSIVDVCFIAYWLIVWLDVVPDEYMFKDYRNQILQDWNWSFLPLDLLVSATGIFAYWLWRKQNDLWKISLTISLSLMFCAGLQAISFWWLRSDFDVSWWAMNLVLMVVPLSAILLSIKK